MSISGISSASSQGQAAVAVAPAGLTGAQPVALRQGSTQAAVKTKKHGGERHKPSAPSPSDLQAAQTRQNTYNSQGVLSAATTGASARIDLLA
jgi:hypothetical protein